MDIPKIYRSTFLQIGLLFWVESRMPFGVDTIDSIREFIKYTELEDVHESHLYQMYLRKNRELVEARRHERKNKTPFKPPTMEDQIETLIEILHDTKAEQENNRNDRPDPE